jgi:hypothetical protein
LGSLLTVCGAYIVIISVAADLLRAYSLVIILGLILGIVMMIAGLFFMEMLIKGSSLVFSGIQLILFDQLFLLIDGGITDGVNLLTKVGVPILIVGIILLIIGFRE